MLKAHTCIGTDSAPIRLQYHGEREKQNQRRPGMTDAKGAWKLQSKLNLRKLAVFADTEELKQRWLLLGPRMRHIRESNDYSMTPSYLDSLVTGVLSDDEEDEDFNDDDIGRQTESSTR
jgi:hypothetical protein